MKINHSIQKIEELSMNALPAIETNMYDGWILRFANGYTKRANSINPIYPSNEELDRKIEKIEKVYRKKDLPIVYKMTEQATPENLDGTLELNGYLKDGLTSVQTASLKEMNVEIEHKAIVFDTLHDEWFIQFCSMNKVSEKDQFICKQILGQIIPTSRYFLLSDENDEVLACGMSILEGEYIGIFDIITSEKYRNKGYGRKLMQNILQWGKDNGATYAYLQVMLKNTAAIKLYSTLGFSEIYKYWYRIKE